MLLEILLSFAAILAARVPWMRWRYDLHKIPSPPGLPLLGHTLDLLRGGGESELNRYVGTSWKAMGEPDVLKLNFGGKTILYVRNIDCARNVVLSKTAPFPQGGLNTAFILPMIGNESHSTCLATEMGVSPYAKAARRVYMQGLQPSNFKAAMPKLHVVLDKMMECIDEQREAGSVDFQQLCVRMTLDAIGVVAFDTELGGLDRSRQIYELLLKAGYISVQQLYNPLQAFLYKLLPFLKRAREKTQILLALHAEWDWLTKEILTRDDPAPGKEPMWHILRSMKDPETGRDISYETLRSEVALMVLAGMDTTGHQLSFILALLASAPHVTKKLIVELKEHDLYGPNCRKLVFEDLADLPYLSAVVKEGIRVSYILPAIFPRRTPKDIRILGYLVPKGTLVSVIGRRWFNSESEWGDPYVFRPERWLTGEDVSQKYYLPFSYGPRDCVGQKLAMLEMRVALVRLIQKYDLVPTCPAEELLKNSRNGLVIESVDGVWLHAKSRE